MSHILRAIKIIAALYAVIESAIRRKDNWLPSIFSHDGTTKRRVRVDNSYTLA